LWRCAQLKISSKDEKAVRAQYPSAMNSGSCGKEGLVRAEAF
jgi:hypothetical protein